MYPARNNGAEKLMSRHVVAEQGNMRALFLAKIAQQLSGRCHNVSGNQKSS